MLRVVVMPDIFIDHFVHVDGPADLLGKMARVAGRGGGNIVTGVQRMGRGGNAANTAAALSALGVEVTLIAAAGPTTRRMAGALIPREVGLVLRPRDEDNLTVAIEMGGANVMLSYPGALDFGPQDVGEDGWSLIESADMVGVFNWNMNRKANNLLRALLCEGGLENVYLDIGDPAVAPEEKLRGLISILSRCGAAVLGLNRWEATYLAERISGRRLGPTEAAEAVFKSLSLRHLDLHTEEYSYTLPESARAPSYPVSPKLLTGAGDAWNAGNMYGYLVGWPGEKRLRFANAVAGCYLSKARHCVYREVEAFMTRAGAL